MTKRINATEAAALQQRMRDLFHSCRVVTQRGARTGISATLAKMQITENRLTCKLLRAVAIEMNLPCRHSTYPNADLQINTWVPDSMSLGVTTQSMTWAEFKTPSIYAIVCKSSGRRYIGASMTPELRRAVHLYWLKNYWRWGCSNVFFGSLKVKEDVEKYGVDDFHMEILEQCPDAKNYTDMWEREWAWVERTPEKKLYNRDKIYGEYNKRYSTFVEINEESLQRYERYVNAGKDFENAITSSALARERRKELEALPMSKPPRYKRGIKTEKSQLLKQQQERIIFLRKEKNRLLTVLNKSRRDLVKFNNKLRIKYSKSKTPLY